MVNGYNSKEMVEKGMRGNAWFLNKYKKILDIFAICTKLSNRYIGRYLYI